MCFRLKCALRAHRKLGSGPRHLLRVRFAHLRSAFCPPSPAVAGAGGRPRRSRAGSPPLPPVCSQRAPVVLRRQRGHAGRNPALGPLRLPQFSGGGRSLRPSRQFVGSRQTKGLRSLRCRATRDLHCPPPPNSLRSPLRGCRSLCLLRPPSAPLLTPMPLESSARLTPVSQSSCNDPCPIRPLRGLQRLA